MYSSLKKAKKGGLKVKKNIVVIQYGDTLHNQCEDIRDEDIINKSQCNMFGHMKYCVTLVYLTNKYTQISNDTICIAADMLFTLYCPLGHFQALNIYVLV